MTRLFSFGWVSWGLMTIGVLTGHAQQIVCERLLTAPGLQLAAPSACVAPNGEFIITSAARPASSSSLLAATHTFVARLQANGCDTLWQRKLLNYTAYYLSSSVQADAHGIWLLTQDSVIANSIGIRLWRLNAAGRVRYLVKPPPQSTQERPNFLLPAADGGVYAQVYNQSLQTGGPRAPGILRFDSAGTLRWRHDYGYALNYYSANLAYTSTGHVLITGMVGVGGNYGSHPKLLEVESSRGDSVRGVNLPWGPNVSYETLNSSNNQPMGTVALTGGGYVLRSVVNIPMGYQTGQLTRLDINYNVLWRYQLPSLLASTNEYNLFQQVQELADGTLLALVGSHSLQRTFWLYRFQAATGVLLNIYPFTVAVSGIDVGVAYLLPVASDSTLVAVGSSRISSNTTQSAGIYVARLRVPGLPRVVAPALPLAARPPAGTLSFGLYPNPAQAVVTLELPARPGLGQLELRDAVGRLVRSQAVGAGAQQVRWSLAGVAPGLYAVVLRGGAGGAAVRHLSVE